MNEEYSTVINLQNEFKLRRLTNQECTINNNIQKNSNKGKGAISNYEFSFGKDIASIKIKENIIDELIINNPPQTVINEETLISK